MNDVNHAVAEDVAADNMARYYAQHAVEYERIYQKPERQADLRAIEHWLAEGPFIGRRVLEVACGTGLHARLEPGARVVFLDNRYVTGSSTPLSRTDARGNTYQRRRLDDGSIHEVLKNFPTREDSFSVLGPRAANAEWIEYPHYWVLSYELN